MLPSPSCQYSFVFVLGCASLSLAAEGAYLPQDANTWVKRSPLPSAPPSPGLSYETSLGYDPVVRISPNRVPPEVAKVLLDGQRITELF
ncbi:hypothetical protein ETAA8_41340 [Anatilimnocola aggregata]|uniref:Uncharacterized protein n=1 Tax=Anatilimnocola aggregata TaxID=2528021 RepID=A0A517YFL7_9BACT|nr:hypothetical protein [Anatilimnocola aggregata]QDU29027.1 hypothetical protein ETAA8_41340 [Anatilimnocola aggregata]